MFPYLRTVTAYAEKYLIYDELDIANGQWHLLDDYLGQALTDDVTTATPTLISGSFTMPEEDIMLTASQTNIDYTITYDYNVSGMLDAQGYPDNSDNYTVDPQAVYSTTYVMGGTIDLPRPTADHHIFIGWRVTACDLTDYDDAYASTGWNAGDSQTGDLLTGHSESVGQRIGNITLTAEWEIQTFTFQYNDRESNGESFPEDVPWHGTVSDPSIGIPQGDLAPGYEIVGWYEDISYNGSPFDFSTEFERDYYLFAKWEAIEYTITYDLNGGDGSLAPTTYTVETSERTLLTPTREGYVFNGWMASQTEGSNKLIHYSWTYDNPLFEIPQWEDNRTHVAVPDLDYYNAYGDVTLTAQWVEAYTITWVDGNGNTLATDTVKQGDMPSYTGSTTPTKTVDAQYSYEFNGNWSPEIVSVTGPATYTAQFDSTVNKYTIRFVNDNGEELQSTLVPYGQTPAYNGATPTKAATQQYTYTFNGWDSEIQAVTDNATYTATYSETLNQYTVTFVDEDGTVLKAATYYYYGTPAEDIETPADPTKASTAQYSYTFAGWSPAINEVTGNATYTATYDSTVNQYTVTFKDDNGTVLSEEPYYYGTAAADIVTPADPSKAATQQYSYTFAGWSPAIAEVTGKSSVS